MVKDLQKFTYTGAPFEAYLHVSCDYAYYDTEDYQKAMRKRQVWVEPKFGEAKQWHQGRRFRLRRLRKVNIEALIRAAGQNIKQLLKRRISSNTPKPPAYEAALRLISWFFQLCAPVPIQNPILI
jgi:hypothetical protein